jgi:hypothetical protein
MIDLIILAAIKLSLIKSDQELLIVIIILTIEGVITLDYPALSMLLAFINIHPLLIFL